MLTDPRYDEWFRLRDFELDRFVKEHTFEENVACLLFFLGSQGGYRETTAAFAVSKSWTVELIGIFLARIQAAFEAKGRIPGVVGAIDESLVENNRSDDFEGYFCRKMHPALIVQAVVNDKMQFMSTEIRPGSWSDQNAWRASALGSRIDNYLPTGTHFLGDADYAICPAIMTPFVGNTGECLTRKQLLYNYQHSRSRIAVECSFGLWKGRFRIVKCRLNTKSVEKAVDIVAATIVLHIILMDMKDDTSFEDEVAEWKRGFF
ncbi:uncharacterized protein PITG_05084 [Phytophthora infestans T30-4]|uniref:DDE Tnp4 domain-containing protein n=1 Tax=Phytophthora infestans (strain T30-4) TaxID=403677 RepID=D0N3I5_PHYIT|nr:uncharacterized protein PITG_05084 [Phytophthora infestans T30-4]EEY68939.1 conserved hypothetical protein [Phytophthora infestans T30-4]|eukprot:XP_002998793.1 conserved hypothetical protein [Phytophthora infestans T30-4]